MHLSLTPAPSSAAQNLRSCAKEGAMQNRSSPGSRYSLSETFLQNALTLVTPHSFPTYSSLHWACYSQAGINECATASKVTFTSNRDFSGDNHYSHSNGGDGGLQAESVRKIYSDCPFSTFHITSSSLSLALLPEEDFLVSQQKDKGSQILMTFQERFGEFQEQ